jgi:two-component sensor histidine kinase
MKTVEEKDILLALEPRLESAALARHALACGTMRGDVEHSVLLLTTEVVANAIRHAGLRADDRVTLSARLRPDFARVEVSDLGPGFDPEKVKTRGAGLQTLGELASRWGVVCSDKGCTVWFEVGRRRRFTKRQDDVAARHLRASAEEMAAAIRDLLRRP